MRGGSGVELIRLQDHYLTVDAGPDLIVHGVKDLHVLFNAIVLLAADSPDFGLLKLKFVYPMIRQGWDYYEEGSEE